SSVSALHGPAMIKGLSPVSNQDFKGTMSNVCFIFLCNFLCFLYLSSPQSSPSSESRHSKGEGVIISPLLWRRSGEYYTFSFLIYSPMMVKLIVCFSTFRIAAS